MKKIMYIAVSMLLVSGLSACGSDSGSEFTITFINQTGSTINDIRIASANGAGEWGDNRIDTPLYSDDSTEIDLSDISEEDAEAGMYIELYDSADFPMGEVTELSFSNGNTVTVYFTEDNQMAVDIQ